MLSQATEEGFELGKASGSFKANSKALAEGAGEGIAKVIVFFLASANLGSLCDSVMGILAS